MPVRMFVLRKKNAQLVTRIAPRENNAPKNESRETVFGVAINALGGLMHCPCHAESEEIVLRDAFLVGKFMNASAH